MKKDGKDKKDKKDEEEAAQEIFEKVKLFAT
jgi:hypothetical protein